MLTVVTNMQLQLLKDCILGSEFLKLHNVFFKLCFITQSTMKEKNPIFM